MGPAATQPAAVPTQAPPALGSTEAKSEPERLNVINREDWLTAVAGRMAPWFADLGCPLPRVRMSSIVIKRTLRERWGCKDWHSDNVAGIAFPALDELRKKFDEAHGEQEWDKQNTWRENAGNF
jgi:hypothetical protein